MEALSPSLAPPPPVVLTQDELKKIAAYKASSTSNSGWSLALSTGSTARHAIDRIGELLRLGKLNNIVRIPTSKMTHEQALSLGISLSDLDPHPVVDVAIDNVDEMNPHLNLVKGRGRSLLREKMVKSACKKFIVIVNKTKLVKHLGRSGLACLLKLCPFAGSSQPKGWKPCLRALTALGSLGEVAMATLLSLIIKWAKT